MRDFSPYVTEAGAGRVAASEAGWTLRLPPITAAHYHNAQITSYRGRREFAFSPPVRLRVRAHAQGALRGTAGFGFWNHPFAPGERGVRLPRALWFFFSALPNHLPLALEVPGHGWKAATFDATRAAFLALLPAAPVGFLLMRSPALYRRLWPVGQWALGVGESALDAALLAEPHDYDIHWQPDGVTFRVDGATVHQAAVRLHGPLGFVAWVDNQYAIVTPQGQFGFGRVDAPEEQALVIGGVQIERGASPRS